MRPGQPHTAAVLGSARESPVARGGQHARGPEADPDRATVRPDQAARRASRTRRSRCRRACSSAASRRRRSSRRASSASSAAAARGRVATTASSSRSTASGSTAARGRPRCRARARSRRGGRSPESALAKALTSFVPEHLAVSLRPTQKASPLPAHPPRVHARPQGADDGLLAGQPDGLPGHGLSRGARPASSRRTAARASGVMIGPRHLLTVSHVIDWTAPAGFAADWVRFTPSYFDGARRRSARPTASTSTGTCRRTATASSAATRACSTTSWSCSTAGSASRPAGWARAATTTTGTASRPGRTSAIPPT